MTVQVKLDQAAIDRMLHGPGGHVDNMMGGFVGIAPQAVKDVANRRVKRRTGEYLAGIGAEQKSPDTVEVYARAPHSAILEEGSRPHRIVARRASVLAFEVGGRTVFARSVQHPGTKAYHILRDGVADAGKQLGKLQRS